MANIYVPYLSKNGSPDVKKELQRAGNSQKEMLVYPAFAIPSYILEKA